VILIDNGDVSIGTRFFQVHGVMGAAKVLRWMQMDAMILGNHDVESISNFSSFSTAARLKLLSEYHSDLDPDGISKAWIIRSGNNVTVGIVGVSVGTLIQTALDLVRDMQSKNVTILVVASHCGIEWDKDFADHAKGLVNVIIGGHSHVLEAFQRNNDAPLIVHSGSMQSTLGVVRFDLDPTARVFSSFVHLTSGPAHKLSEAFLRPMFSAAFLEETVLGSVTVASGGEGFASNSCRKRDCAPGIFVASAMRWYGFFLPGFSRRYPQS